MGYSSLHAPIYFADYYKLLCMPTANLLLVFFVQPQLDHSAQYMKGIKVGMKFNAVNMVTYITVIIQSCMATVM